MNRLLILIAILPTLALGQYPKPYPAGGSSCANIERELVASNPTLDLDPNDWEYLARENLVATSEPQSAAESSLEGGSYSYVAATPSEWNGLFSSNVARIDLEDADSYVYMSTTFTEGEVYTCSIYLRRTDGAVPDMRNVLGSDAQFIVASIQPAKTVDAPTVTAIGNGLYKVTETFTHSAATGLGYCGIIKRGREHPTTSSSENPILFQGWHVRRASTSPTYVPTTTAAVTGLTSEQIASIYSKRGSISFTGSGTGKPYRTRADRLENRVIYSEDISKVAAGQWGYVRVTNISATEFKEDGTASATHAIYQDFPAVIAGTPYYIAVNLKRGAGARNATFTLWNNGLLYKAIVNLADGTVATTGTTGTWTVAPSVSADGDFYRVSAVFTPTASASTQRLEVFLTAGASTLGYSGDNTSSIHLTKVQFQPASASPTYIPTTDYPQYASPGGGRRWIRFDGADDVLTSTATLDDVFAAGAKEVVLVGNSATSDYLSNVFNSSVPNFLIGFTTTGSGTIRVLNDDGILDVAEKAFTDKEKNFLVNAYHDGTNIGIKVNGGAFTTTASGNTAVLTDTLILGDGTFNGSIARLITWDKVLPASKRTYFSKCLSKMYGVDLQ